MNIVIIEGRLARDVSTKDTGSTTVARFTVAVSRPKTKDAAEAADFISCVAFGKTAEHIAKYFNKGKPILLTGHIQTGSYDDRDGKKIYTTDVIVERVEFVLADKSGGAAKADNFTEIDADDVPF